MNKYPVFLWLALASLTAGCWSEDNGIVQIGAGSYTTVLPAGLSLPMNGDGTVARPMVSPALTKPVITHKWWSSLLWPYKGPYSSDMWAHPLIARAEARGLQVGYPTEYEISETRYFAVPRYDLLLGSDSLNVAETRLLDYGDWSVTAEWPGTSNVRATMGRGLPFVWVEGGSARISLLSPNSATVSINDDTAVIRAGSRTYAAFAPSGTSWTREAESIQAPAAVYVVALLPDDSPETLSLFRAHAFNVVRDTHVSWAYDAEASTVTSTFKFETDRLDPNRSGSGTLTALYRHQWLHAEGLESLGQYESPRGTMHLVSAPSFTTTVVYGGALPRLPDLCLSGGDDRLKALLETEFEAESSFTGIRAYGDTYFSGKALGRLSELISLARAVRLQEQADGWTSELRGEVESWLSAADTARQFYYNPTWKTLVGHPSSNGADSDLNDHHFHYGYHIQAAAGLARADSAWGAAWAPMVDLLIRDAVSADRADAMFPFLRSFDPYAGHGIANGHSSKIGGYDQEASSEAMNMWAAVIQWGLERDDTEIRDLGIWMYATERTAIEQYWFDVDGVVFPPEFDHTTNAILWGRGGEYTTWWSEENEFIHGINYLPLTGASYYLGRRPDYIRANDAELYARTGGAPTRWLDLSTMFYALADPAGARERFEGFAASYEPEGGESQAHTHHWLSVLEQVGTPDTTTTANVPAYRVFHNGKRRAYAAYNPRSIATRARFSDGVEFRIPPRTQLTVCR